MSRENVEVVRAVYAEWERGNFRAGLEIYDAHLLFLPPVNHPAHAPYVGVHALTEFMRDFLSAWANLSVAAEEFIEAENSVVIANVWRGEGRESGAATEFRDFMVWTFRGPKLIRLEQFEDRVQALEAVGLRD